MKRKAKAKNNSPDLQEPIFNLLVAAKGEARGRAGMICFSIRSSVKEISAQATEQYTGEKVEALMAYVNSENHSLRQRNRAVWALGQIGDERALPVLTASYTGQPCDNDSRLCQRELQKAIKKCKGSFNATAWLPR